MDKYITRTTGGWTFTLHVETNPLTGERYIGLTSVAGTTVRHAHAYLSETETKELIEALGGYYNA